MRKMASIQKILDIQPIEGADAIEVATVNGWKVVVAKKDNFKVGDLVVYCEIDSWTPHDLAPFLSKGQPPREYNGVKGERLRTIRLRGQISQGLILPLSVVPASVFSMPTFVSEGDDVSELLGVQKYEPPMPACLGGVARGNFPSQIPKTDEERIQNVRREWSNYQTYLWRVTEKLDGSSCTMALIDDVFHVCSRNLDLTETEGNSFWAVARQYDVENKMRVQGLNNFAIQGELVGEGIQGNKYKIKGQRFYVFKMYDIVKGEYLLPVDCENLAASLNLLHVPVVNPVMVLTEMNIDKMIEFADGKSAIQPNTIREGVVLRQIDGQEHFKSISNAFLMKTGE